MGRRVGNPWKRDLGQFLASEHPTLSSPREKLLLIVSTQKRERSGEYMRPRSDFPLYHVRPNVAVVDFQNFESPIVLKPPIAQRQKDANRPIGSNVVAATGWKQTGTYIQQYRTALHLYRIQPLGLGAVHLELSRQRHPCRADGTAITLSHTQKKRINFDVSMFPRTLHASKRLQKYDIINTIYSIERYIYR